MREGLRVRELANDEGSRLLRIVRRCSGSVVTWRRAQMVLLSAQGMDITQIARVAFTIPDRVRDVINNFNDGGVESLYPRYAGGRPPRFTLGQRQAIKKIALSRQWITTCHSQRGVCRSWPSSWCDGGCGTFSARRAPVSSDQDVEDLDGPRLRGEEEPGARALRHRRWQYRAWRRRSDTLAGCDWLRCGWGQSDVYWGCA